MTAHLRSRPEPSGPDRRVEEAAAAYDPRAAFEWAYQDESGAPLFHSVRTPEKQFWQSPADGHGGWVKPFKGCMDGVRLVPLYLPEVLAAIRNSGLILITEGERKVDLLRHWGFVATCNVSGAIRSKLWFDHAKEFFSAGCYAPKIIVLPDHDEAGRTHADTIGAAFAAVGITIRILDLPGIPFKGDVLDWYDRGGTREQLDDLIEREARPWEPSEAPSERIKVNREAFARNGAHREQDPPAIITRRASDIMPEPISWLWKYWLARGKLHIIGGVPETGKTTIALGFAAIVSSGATWPDGTRATVGNVLIWTSEDDPADTLVPRLIRMGADLERVHFIEEAIPPGAKLRPFNPATDMLGLVAKAAAIGDVVLLILDPIVAAMPMTRNSHNNAETRNGMQPVVDFAEAADIALIGISHLAKGTAGKDPLERLNGSGAFGALPRLVMDAAKNEAEGDGEPERIMVRIKSNIGPSGGGFGYHIDMATLHENPDIEATRIVWEDALEGTARQLLADAEGLDEDDDKTSKVAVAMVFLKTALAHGERLGREVADEAKKAGISERTLERATKGTVGKRKAALGWYWWSLP